MKSPEELKAMLDAAFQAGCTSVEIDGVKFFRKKKKKTGLPSKKETRQPPEQQKDFPIPPGMTEEEILFWSTPTYDDLQEQKKIREEQLKLERNLRG